MNYRDSNYYAWCIDLYAFWVVIVLMLILLGGHAEHALAPFVTEVMQVFPNMGKNYKNTEFPDFIQYVLTVFLILSPAMLVSFGYFTWLRWEYFVHYVEGKWSKWQFNFVMTVTLLSSSLLIAMNYIGYTAESDQTKNIFSSYRALFLGQITLVFFLFFHSLSIWVVYFLNTKKKPFINLTHKQQGG